MVARRLLLPMVALAGALQPAVGETIRMTHPLHTTLTEVAVDPARHTVRAVVRVFADDITAALARRAHGKTSASISDADATSYVLSELSMADQSSRPIALTACGVKHGGDLLWVCIEAGPVDPRSVQVRNTVLCELFSDQVNIVQVSGGAVARSILFTRGDGPKPLW